MTKPLCWIRMVKGFLQNNAPDLRDKQADQPTVILLTGTIKLLFAVNVPRGVFCEQSSQKTRELWREIMQSMISVHREACYCERSEQ